MDGETRTVEFAAAPWVVSWCCYAETLPHPVGDEKAELGRLQIMDIWKAGWKAAIEYVLAAAKRG